MAEWDTHKDPLLRTTESEVFITSQGGVTLYVDNGSTKWCTDGKLTVTSHHLFYQCSRNEPGSALRLDLDTISRASHPPTMDKGFLFSSDKIFVFLPSSKKVKLSFKKGGMVDFYNALKSMLEKKHWAVPTAQPVSAAAGLATAAGPQQPASSPTSGLRQVGIAGIMEDSKERAKMSETFTDIDDVMNRASVLVKEINRLKLNASSGVGPAVDSTAIESIEATLGLGTMVQRNAGEGQLTFHSSLAIELHAWMTHEKNAHLFGQMHLVPLVELFSLYNKARSGNFISPDDLLGACRKMESAVPNPIYELQDLSSGRKALVNKDLSVLLYQLLPVLGPRYTGKHEQEVFARCSQETLKQPPRHLIPTLKEFPKANELKSVNEAKVASILQLSIPVARDIMMHLQQKGYLCSVDMEYGGSTFFWNVFLL